MLVLSYFPEFGAIYLYQVWVPFDGVDLKSNQKVVGYSMMFCATVVPLGISCQASHYCSSQSSQLGKTSDLFYPLVACIAPPALKKKLSSRDEASSWLPWSKAQVCGVSSNFSEGTPRATETADIVWGITWTLLTSLTGKKISSAWYWAFDRSMTCGRSLSPRVS